VIVYSTATWKPVTSPLGTGEENAASFSPDGSMLATDTGAGTVQLWDIPSGQPIGAPLPGVPDAGVIPIITPDGTHVIAGYQFSRAYLWDVRRASLIRHACEVAGRRLTRAEWNAFLPARAYRPAC
jgi:WD40 repeat protein